MIDLCKLIWCAFAGLFRSRAALEAEILVLRHQLNVLRRKSPGRLAFSSIDRLVFAGMYALAPNILDALAQMEFHSNTIITHLHAASERRTSPCCEINSPALAEIKEDDFKSPGNVDQLADYLKEARDRDVRFIHISRYAPQEDYQNKIRNAKRDCAVLFSIS